MAGLRQGGRRAWPGECRRNAWEACFCPPPLPSSPGESQQGFQPAGHRVAQREMVWALNIPGAGVFSGPSGGCMCEGRPSLPFDVGTISKEAAWISLSHSPSFRLPTPLTLAGSIMDIHLPWYWQGRGLCFGLKWASVSASELELPEVRLYVFP